MEWIKYQNVLMPNQPPHIVISLSEEEAKRLIMQYRPYFIRWISDWDCQKSSCFWYVIKDKKEELSSYRSKIRYQIKKGLKNCRVEKIDRETLIKSGYEVYKEAFKRYKTFLKPQSFEDFQKGIMRFQGDFFGVYVKNKLVGYSQNIIQNGSVHYKVVKLHPSYLNYYSSYALFFVMNRYYLNEKNFLYVSDGARALSHQTNIQHFLISKFHFRKAYCKLNIVYRDDVKVLVYLLFPFRGFVYKLKGNIFQKIAVLLKHEEVRRECLRKSN